MHIGDGSNRLIYLKRMAEETEIPVKQVIPTHINRTKTVLEAGLEFAKLGGYVDMTTSSDPDFLEEDEVKASHAIKFMLENNIKPEQILCSSDGKGSMPIFNKKGELTGVGICKCSSLYREVRDAVLNDAVKFEHAIMTITSNPADAYKLSNKGKIKEGFDADLVILNKDNLLINDVLAKGKFVVKNCKNIIQGTFE